MFTAFFSMFTSIFQTIANFSMAAEATSRVTLNTATAWELELQAQAEADLKKLKASLK